MRTFIEVEAAKKFYKQAIKNAEDVIEEIIKKDRALIKFEKDMQKNVNYELMVVVHSAYSEIRIIGQKQSRGFKNYVTIGFDGTKIDDRNIDDFPLMKEYIKRLEKITSKYFKGDK